jgi:hypothetical protein
VAQIMNEPVIATFEALCGKMVSSFVATGGSLYARRDAFSQAHDADTSKGKEALKAQFKIAHVVGKVCERDGCDEITARAYADAFFKKSVEDRIATRFDATRNEQHIYVSAGVAFIQMLIDTGYKEKKASTSRGPKATTIEEVLKKDEKQTPTATTPADFAAWFTAQASIVARYMEVNKTLVHGTQTQALALCAKSFVDGVNAANKVKAANDVQQYHAAKALIALKRDAK